ncbi:MAG: hypothetical protein HFJ51_02275 [Clostridia bacterium]|nr:hypothetical protein [Clostridia bacterium]
MANINIDTDRYQLLDGTGYLDKTEAYDTIRIMYSHLQGVTTYFSDGLWYIVQNKALK